MPARAVDLAGFAVFESPVVSSQYRVRFRFQYMTSCSTYNRSQSLFDDSGINATISDSEIVALISQTVQAAMAAERAKVLSSTLSPGSSSIASATIGGVPAVSPCSLTPATIIAQPCAGRAVSSSSIIVPWFVSTFAAVAMSALSLASCAASFLAGPSRNSGHAAVASVLQPSALAVADQLFVDGPGVSPVLAKFVSQIVAGKNVDLCGLLPRICRFKSLSPSLSSTIV